MKKYMRKGQRAKKKKTMQGVDTNNLFLNFSSNFQPFLPKYQKMLKVAMKFLKNNF